MEKIKNKIIIIMIFLAGCGLVKSQEYNTSSQGIIPKSPEVQAFEQYGETPVSEYTGIPGISIPIYTVRSGDLELPITLDYLGTAIRVDQEATWVGLNWLLNAGGAISTKISGYYPGEVGEEDWKQLYDGRISIQTVGYHPDIEQRYKWTPTAGINLFRKCNTTDYKPDDISPVLYKEIMRYQNGEAQLFSANFMGRNIKFIYHRLENRFIVVGKDQKVKIAGSPGYVSSITDEQGILYRFNETETNAFTTSYSSTESHQGNAKSHYLTEIYSPQGRSIILRYKKNTEIRPLPRITQSGYQDYPGKSSNIETHEHSSIKINNSYLYEIESDDAIVRFNVGNRTDLRGGKKLDSIEIYEKTASQTAARKVKTIKFIYGYFEKNTTGGNLIYDVYSKANLLPTYNSFYGDNEIYTRLKLLSIQEEVVNAQNVVEKKPPYSFTYYGPDLPAKSSAAIDYWGYYNSQENSVSTPSLWGQIAHTIIPTSWDGINDFNNPQAYYIRADRRPNSSRAYACMLSNIKYPTGGSSTFTYELHEFASNANLPSKPSGSLTKGGGVRIKQITNSEGVITNYEYKLENGSSSGILMEPLKFAKKDIVVYQDNDFEGSPLIAPVDTEYWVESSENLIPAYENRIAYSRVSVYNSTGANGKTVYEFWNQRMQPANLFFKPMEDPRNGNLMKKSVFQGSSTVPTQEDSYAYNILNKESYFINTIVNDKYIGGDKCVRISEYSSANPYREAARWRTEVYIYPSVKYWIEVTKKTTKTDNVSEEFTYEYNPANQSLYSVSKKVKDNEYDLSYYVYPSDYNYSGSNYPGRLVEKNIIAAPMEIVKGIKKGTETKITGGVINKYDDSGNVIETSQLEITNPLLLSSFKFSNKSASGILPNNASYRTTYSPYSGYIKSASYSYNSKGSLLYSDRRNDSPTVYLWGYNNQYPIVEIKNTTYADVKVALSYSDTQIDAIASRNLPTAAEMAKIDGLRSSMPQAQVTTYTYKPLVGVEKIKDPRGIETVYGYDSFGRMNRTTYNGSVMNEYQYKYKP